MAFKEIEGCSTRTLNYYKDNITKMLDTINLPIDEITTEILRNYLADYKSNSNAGMVTIDNIRTLACSSSSRMSTTEPSPMTKPSREALKGRDACSGSSLRVERACIELKPPTPAG